VVELLDWKKVPELFQQGITTLDGPPFHHFDGLSGHFLLRGQLPRVDSGVLLGDDLRDIDAEPPARRQHGKRRRGFLERRRVKDLIESRDGDGGDA